MIFDSRPLGRLLSVVGQRREATQYTIGNPLTALQMAQPEIGIELYAPLRVSIFQGAEGKTHLEYDRPLSLAGRWEDPRVASVARELDEKLERLARVAMERLS